MQEQTAYQAIKPNYTKKALNAFFLSFFALFILAGLPATYLMNRNQELNNQTTKKTNQQNLASNQESNVMEIFVQELESSGETVDSEFNDSIEKVDLAKLGDKNIDAAIDELKEATNGTQESVATSGYKPTNFIYGDGSENSPFQIQDKNDPLWQKFEPQDFQNKYDPETEQLIISWTDENEKITPYMFLAGYWFEDFNPSEKFNIENLTEDQMIEWTQNVPDIENSQTTDRQLLQLNLEHFSLFSNKAYYYLYIRTNINETYTDFIYGPYEFDLK